VLAAVQIDIGLGLLSISIPKDEVSEGWDLYINARTWSPVRASLTEVRAARPDATNADVIRLSDRIKQKSDMLGQCSHHRCIFFARFLIFAVGGIPNSDLKD
jgi:hypothetical protein